VYTELFGVADSSAAFGVGMTRTIEQGDPENFSANCKAGFSCAVRGAAEAAPFQSARFIYQCAIYSGMN
jgi:hypothetical protein